MRTVAVALKAEVTGYIANLKTAAGATRDLGKALETAAKADKLDEVTRNMAVAGGGLLAFAGYAVKAAADFDAGMSKVSAATHASTRDLDALRAAALQAGKETAYSATEAAQAITELSKAGVSARDILGGGLKGALSLAAAGELDVGEAAETAATALTQFKLNGAAVPHVADLLAAAAGKAQGEVHDMGYALKQSGLVAAQFGVSIEETSGTLAAFASAGLIGSDAGTSFKTMLLMLANPSEKSAALMKALGIAAYDASGKFVGIRDLAGQLQTKLSGLTQQQRDAALATIFGSDAIRSANVLYQQGAKGIGDWTNKVDDAGYAADTAARKTDNLKGDLERLKGTLDTIAIQSGSGGAGGLRLVVKAADELATSFANMPPMVSSALTVVVGLTGALLLGTAGWLRYRKAVGETLDQLRQVGPAGEKAATGLQASAKWAGRATAAFVGLEILNTIGGLFASEAPNVEKMAGALRKVADSGDMSQKTLAKAGLDLKQFGHDLKLINNLGGIRSAEKGAMLEPGFMKALDSSVQSTLERWKAYDATLAQMVQSGNASSAAVIFQQLAAAAAKQGKSTAEVMALLPGYQDAMGAAASAATSQSKAQEQSTVQAKLLESSWDSLIDKAGSLKDAFDSINGAHLNFFDATRASVRATADLQEALQASHGAVDNSSEAAMKAGDSLSAWIDKQKELIQGTYDEAVANGQSVTAADQSRQAYERTRESLIGMLMATGNSRAEAERLAAQLYRMPKVTEVTVVAPTVQTVAERLDALANKLGVINRTYTANIILNETRIQRQINEGTINDRRFGPNRWGGLYEPAATGLLREASTYPAANPGRYMIAEPATGGEAFVPRHGNYGRSMSILSRAASWYGARVMPAGGGGTEVVAPVILQLDGRTVWESQARFKTRSNKTTLDL